MAGRLHQLAELDAMHAVEGPNLPTKLRANIQHTAVARVHLGVCEAAYTWAGHAESESQVRLRALHGCAAL
eukprot:3536025-Pleurochrysis_carterae.AAC.3